MTDELEQVIDTFRRGEKVEESLIPGEYLGAGGVGLPGTLSKRPRKAVAIGSPGFTS